MGADGSDAGIAAAWREHRRYLLDVAYRMLGTVTDAEDVVQEAFARLLREDLDAIQDVRGWLVVVTTRLSLDQLRSARARRQAYIGPWLPEPLIEPPGAEPDPADRITLDDSVRMAMLVVLEQLTPAERAAFVLHDVFQYSFDEVGSIVGRSPVACRQLATRARRRIQQETGPARFDVDARESTRVAARFIQAATNGDFQALMDVLDPDVVGWGDSGGTKDRVARTPTVGRVRLATNFLHFVQDFGVRLVPMAVNGGPGALAFLGDHLTAVFAFETRDGLITRINGIANPAKIAYVASLLKRSS
jgi:RNA polymerase sigma-70 factor (ECF subfamily)